MKLTIRWTAFLVALAIGCGLTAVPQRGAAEPAGSIGKCTMSSQSTAYGEPDVPPWTYGEPDVPPWTYGEPDVPPWVYGDARSRRSTTSTLRCVEWLPLIMGARFVPVTPMWGLISRK